MPIFSFALMIVALIACIFIWWKLKGKPSDKIQLMMFAVLFANMVLFWVQIRAFENDVQLRQRPFLGLEVDVEVLGAPENAKFSDIGKDQEIRIIMKWENDGLSPAIVEYVDLRAFYIYHAKVEGSDKLERQFKRLYGVSDGDLKLDIHSEEDFPIRMQRVFEKNIVMPHRHLRRTAAINGVTWKRDLFATFKPVSEGESLPILILSKVLYRDSQGSRYYLNVGYQLSWLKTIGISKVINLTRCSDGEKPIEVPTGAYVQQVLQLQGIEERMLEGKPASMKLIPLDPRTGVQIKPPSAGDQTVSE